MEFRGSREERSGIWLTEKVAIEEGNAKQVAGIKEWEKSCQVTKNQLPTGKNSKATPRENIARVTPPGDTLVHSADGLTQDAFKICKEFLRPFKKCLRKLNLPNDLPKERRLNSTRKNLIILGDHIDMFLQHYCKTWELKHWKKMLWRFVSLFSAFDEKQLRRLYKYSKANEMSKFLAYYCLNSSDLVTLPENGNLMKLCNTWGLCGDVMIQEKLAQMHPRSPSSSQSPGRVTKK
ncbi:CHD1 helical C-terminal domain containing protein 1 [Tiliqua scincoides]|uniref:CHD1 helical C-terminal domain containing protein 1 n=1 Tax=Tiliqua scincoides TaxID=71010 RepID=UPI00346349C6